MHLTNLTTLVRLFAESIAAANLTAPHPWTGGTLYLRPDVVQEGWKWPEGTEPLNPYLPALQHVLHNYIDPEARPAAEEVLLFRDGTGYFWDEMTIVTATIMAQRTFGGLNSYWLPLRQVRDLVPLDYKLDGEANAARRLAVPTGVHAKLAPKFPHERISDLAYTTEPRMDCPECATSLAEALVLYGQRLRQYELGQSLGQAQHFGPIEASATSKLVQQATQLIADEQPLIALARLDLWFTRYPHEQWVEQPAVGQLEWTRWTAQVAAGVLDPEGLRDASLTSHVCLTGMAARMLRYSELVDDMEIVLTDHDCRVLQWAHRKLWLEFFSEKDNGSGSLDSYSTLLNSSSPYPLYGDRAQAVCMRWARILIHAGARVLEQFEQCSSSDTRQPRESEHATHAEL